MIQSGAKHSTQTLLSAPNPFRWLGSGSDTFLSDHLLSKGRWFFVVGGGRPPVREDPRRFVVAPESLSPFRV